ncbi:RHS repeat-associated core domain-containing protein [Nonomuraea sp. NPDC049684]|uniref:RHS repeat-associated core domain-containing protein n=1 Tax=Nonomuraea sp. NPDC049684 TaxID=3364356 RepID=UPI0037B4E9B1
MESVAYKFSGEVVTRTGTAHTLGYQGGHTDPSSGKISMAARWYQPTIGSFISRDTVTDPDGHKTSKPKKPKTQYDKCKKNLTRRASRSVCSGRIKRHSSARRMPFTRLVRSIGTRATDAMALPYGPGYDTWM